MIYVYELVYFSTALLDLYVLYLHPMKLFSSMKILPFTIVLPVRFGVLNHPSQFPPVLCNTDQLSDSYDPYALLNNTPYVDSWLFLGPRIQALPFCDSSRIRSSPFYKHVPPTEFSLT